MKVIIEVVIVSLVFGVISWLTGLDFIAMVAGAALMQATIAREMAREAA